MSEKVFPACMLIILSSILSTSCARDNVTIDSLLKEMTSRESLTYIPVNQFNLRQFSSYNRESVSPGKEEWFANNDMSFFLRVEENAGRREFVLLDANGPGAIVRWWMTFYKAQDGIIRVYIDNDPLPVISESPRELLRGKLVANPPLAAAVQEGAPLGEVGRDYDHNFYLPLPFSKHCKITYQCDSLVLRYENEGIKVPGGYWWPDVFYNICYRAYAKDIPVESITKDKLESARPLIDETAMKLMSQYPDSLQQRNFEKVLCPGDSAEMAFTGEGCAIEMLRVWINARDIPQALRSTVLRAEFDGFRTIWVPLGEFFGAGYTIYPHRTWMNHVDETGKMESYWVMPYRKKCLITLINYGNDTVRLKLSAGLSDYKWKPGSMYFGATWHEYYNIRTRDQNGSRFDINFVDIKGNGVYVGDQITLFNNTYKWWGEGDEKIFVDGENFPSSFGTGSEDYYGYSFGRQEPFSHPFISQPVGIGNMSWGPTVNMRHRSLDAIPFSKSISSNIELWHWADIRMNYALTAFYYLMPPFSVNIKPDIAAVRHPVVLTETDFIRYEK